MEQQYNSWSMLLSRFMQECGPSSSRVYCFLTQTTNSYVAQPCILLTVEQPALMYTYSMTSTTGVSTLNPNMHDMLTNSLVLIH